MELSTWLPGRPPPSIALAGQHKRSRPWTRRSSSSASARFSGSPGKGLPLSTKYQRDRPALFPDAIEADFRKIDFIRDTFIPDHIDRITGDGPLASFWGDLVPDPNVPNATEVLYMAAVQLRAEMAARRSQLAPGRGIEVGGALMIQQWAEGKGPVGPIGRVVLTMADIALEFVGANPALLGLGGNGEKLIGAVATNLAEMIPDDSGEFGTKGGVPTMVFSENSSGSLPALTHQWPKRCYHPG